MQQNIAKRTDNDPTRQYFKRKISHLYPSRSAPQKAKLGYRKSTRLILLYYFKPGIFYYRTILY